MRKILFAVLLSISVSIYLSGQTPQDTLYLKDGSVVWGKLWDKTRTQYSIKTPEGFLFVFYREQVERMVLGRDLVKENEIQRPEGLGFTMQSGMMIGPADNIIFLQFSFTPMLTYTINNLHSVSAGTGVELYDEVMMPLFAEYKFSFSERRLTPFFYLKGGVLVNLVPDENNEYYSRDYKTGSTVGSGIGLSWPFSRYDSYIQLGYRYSFVKNIYEYKGGGGYVDVEESNVHRLDITFGFKF